MFFFLQNNGLFLKKKKVFKPRMKYIIVDVSRKIISHFQGALELCTTFFFSSVDSINLKKEIVLFAEQTLHMHRINKINSNPNKQMMHDQHI